MSKARHPPFKHGEKRCIFCHAPANSAEHVWPKWAHHLIARRDGHIQLTLEAPITKTIMAETYRRHRQGSIAKVSIQRVCRPCNHGWMGDYEQRLKSTLSAMMVGRNLAVGIDTQRMLTEYFCLKTMVLDWTAADPIFCQDEREAFRKSQEIPSALQLMIAYCPDPRMHSYYRTHFIEAAEKSDLESHTPGKNVKSFAFGFAGIFAFALVIKGSAVGLELEPPLGWLQLFPSRSALYYWPAYISTSKEEAETVASSIELLKRHRKVRLADSQSEAIAETKTGLA